MESAGRNALKSDEAMISARLTECFGIRHPIVCGPMALVTGGTLATAVSRAGGLGIVGRRLCRDAGWRA